MTHVGSAEPIPDWPAIFDAAQRRPTIPKFARGGDPVSVTTVLRTETRWSGELPARFTHRGRPRMPNKPRLAFDGGPTYAEFIPLRLLERAGWDGRWVNSWRGPRAFEIDVGVPLALPDAQTALYNDLRSRMGDRTGGCWDLYCWRGDEVLFVEAKGRYDPLTDGQERWLEAALAAGLHRTDFLIVRQIT